MVGESCRRDAGVGVEVVRWCRAVGRCRVAEGGGGRSGPDGWVEVIGMELGTWV